MSYATLYRSRATRRVRDGHADAEIPPGTYFECRGKARGNSLVDLAAVGLPIRLLVRVNDDTLREEFEPVGVQEQAVEAVPLTEKEWIRVSEIPELYNVGATYASKLFYEIVRSGDCRPDDLIIDGRMKLIKRRALEDFWRRRGAAR